VTSVCSVVKQSFLIACKELINATTPIIARGYMKRKPTSPGEILSEEFLKPLEISQKELADHLDCDYKVINRIVNEQSSVTAEMATKLAAAFDTSPDFWLNAQMAIDLYRERLKNREMPRRRPSFGSGVAGAEAAKLKKFSDAGGSQNLWLSDAGRTDS
jgi:addiction module HigA family antidote